VSPFSAIDYRRYAAECVRLAQSTSDPVDKARLLDMAETFSELADKSETRSRGNPGGWPATPPVCLPFFRRVDRRLFSRFSKIRI